MTPDAPGGSGHGPAFMPPTATSSPARRARQEALRGQTFFERGQYEAAIACFRTAVALQPHEPYYHVTLAVCADNAKLDRLVETHAAEAARLAPDEGLPHYLLANVAHRAGRLEDAITHGAAAVAKNPDLVDFAVLRGTLLFAAGKAREARQAIDRPLAAGSTDRWLASLYARLAPALEEQGPALDAVERALRAPGLSDNPDGKPMLHFAASTLLDRMGRYSEAFEHARLGNEILRGSSPAHDPAQHSDWVSRKIRYFSRDRVESLPRATNGSRRPVFILGMPRSGTTLVEQILACHPAVFPGGEMQALRLVTRDSADADWAAGEPYPEYLDHLSVGRANDLAARYVAAIDSLDGQATYVTDKQPLNFLILHMVELLFPGSRVIHCVRGALDTCLSCYMTNFEVANTFKFDLTHLGAYYHDYLRLMEHWKRVLTVPILDVRYEDVVLDTRGQVRRILEFLELPWDERCLRYYENSRFVGTASVDQVRKPIYTASIGRWKHYEKHLGPLIKALGTPV